MDTAIPVSKTSFTKTYASVLLDLIRGLAAILVLLEHWRNLFFVDYGQIPSHRAWFALPYLLTSAGASAVLIFFVLSGYLISGSVFRMFANGTWSWRRYLTHRLTRLWVVLIPGLLLCALWDALAIHFRIAPALYSGAGPNHMTPNVGATHTVANFFGNLFFLQIVRFPVFGSDGPLWSLAFEFWYYILFPLGLLTVHRSSTLVTRIGSGVLFVAIAYFVGPTILSRFPVWLMGTLLALVPVRPFGKRARWVAALTYVPLLFLSCKSTSPLQPFVLTGATGLLLWIMLSATGTARSSPVVETCKTLSRFSYTLYVAHLPFGLFLTALVLVDSHWLPTAPHVLAALAILIVMLGYCYGLACLTEFHTDKWRERIESRIGLIKRPKSA